MSVETSTGKSYRLHGLLFGQSDIWPILFNRPSVKPGWFFFVLVRYFIIYLEVHYGNKTANQP
jgi:hypothetical protein